MAWLDFFVVTPSNFKCKSLRTKRYYKLKLMSTLLLGIDLSYRCGLFYRDWSYHGNAMTSLLFLLMVESRGFLSKLFTLLAVKIACLMFSEIKQILWERFREIFAWSFRLLTRNKCSRVALVWVPRRAYGKRSRSAGMSFLYTRTTFPEKWNKSALFDFEENELE